MPTTSRGALPYPPLDRSSDDDVPGDLKKLADAVAAGAVLFAPPSLAADRPAPGVPNRMHRASDTGQVSWDTGAAWRDVSLTGQVARVVLAENASGITTSATVMTATPTVVAGRRYKVTSVVAVGSTAAGDEATHTIVRDSTPVAGVDSGVPMTYGAGTSFYTSTRTYTFTAALPGQLIFATAVARRVGTGSLTAAAADSLLLVEDIGPS